MFQPPVLVLTVSSNDLEMSYIAIELASAQVLYTLSHYLSLFHECRIYLGRFYGNTVKVVFQPPDLVLIWALNDLEMPYIGTELLSAHVFYRSSHYLSSFHESRIYLGLFL